MAAKPIMYVKPGCPYCDEQLQRFRSEGVEWTEIDATASLDDRADLMRYSNDSGVVPTVVIGDNVTIGVDGRG